MSAQASSESRVHYDAQTAKYVFENSYPPGATHDYTNRYWGHDYMFTPIDGGMRGRASGWGRGIKEGDFLILADRKDGSRYQVIEIEYYRDPSDMWNATLLFAPRDPNP